MPTLMLSDSGTSLLRNVQCSLSSACFLGGGGGGGGGKSTCSTLVAFWLDRTLLNFCGFFLGG